MPLLNSFSDNLLQVTSCETIGDRKYNQHAADIYKGGHKQYSNSDHYLDASYLTTITLKTSNMQVQRGMECFPKFNNEVTELNQQSLVSEPGSEKQVEGAFLELRSVLPFLPQRPEKLSDLEVLQLAMEYISSLEEVLELEPKQKVKSL